MNLYSHANWKTFRDEVIRLDNGRCVRCRRSRADGVVLQVHHKVYRSGQLPWEYPHDTCETLCKGCHAQEHGKVMPQSGWDCVGSDDLGEFPADHCELCGTGLRHIYLVEHPNWGAMAVGTDCCDRLTGTTEASEYLDSHMKALQKRKRFVSSQRWQELQPGEVMIDQEGIWIRVRRANGKFRVSMDGAQGKVEYDTLLDAKLKAFELIESGEAAAYLERRRRKVEALRRTSRFA